MKNKKAPSMLFLSSSCCKNSNGPSLGLRSFSMDCGPGRGQGGGRAGVSPKRAGEEKEGGLVSYERWLASKWNVNWEETVQV